MQVIFNQLYFIVNLLHILHSFSFLICSMMLFSQIQLILAVRRSCFLMHRCGKCSRTQSPWLNYEWKNPTWNSERTLAVQRTPCTLWCPSGACVSVKSLLWRSLQHPSATSHTSSIREPSVSLGLVYFTLVLRVEDKKRWLCFCLEIMKWCNWRLQAQQCNNILHKTNYNKHIVKNINFIQKL